MGNFSNHRGFSFSSDVWTTVQWLGLCASSSPLRDISVWNTWDLLFHVVTHCKLSSLGFSNTVSSLLQRPCVFCNFDSAALAWTIVILIHLILVLERFWFLLLSSRSCNCERKDRETVTLSKLRSLLHVANYSMMRGLSTVFSVMDNVLLLTLEHFQGWKWMYFTGNIVICTHFMHGGVASFCFLNGRCHF